MATKRKTAASAPLTEDSSRLQLAKAVMAITTAAGSFTKAVEEYKTFTVEAISEVDQRITAAQLDYTDRERDFETKYKKRKVDLDLQFQENERKAALEVLKKQNEVAVSAEELDALRAAASNAVVEREAAVAAAVDKCNVDSKKALHAVAASKELEHKADIAEIKAQNDQLTKQIDSLRQTITEQRQEIGEQRKLTQSVAEASKQGAIQQSFGGKGIM